MAVGLAAGVAVGEEQGAALAGGVAVAVELAVDAGTGAAELGAAEVAAVPAGADAAGVGVVPVGVAAAAVAAEAEALGETGAVAAASLAATGAPDAREQFPATLAELLAPNTPPAFGISNAAPTPATTAMIPTITRSRVRDSGSNLRSWLKTLLLYRMMSFPLLLRVTLPADHDSHARTRMMRNLNFS